jgi:ferredoxin
MKKYRIELIRPPCIYCGACEKLCPQTWIMNSRNDLKADIKKSITKKKEELIIKETLEVDNLKNNLNAAKACPMNIIHIYDIKKNIKLI